MRTPLYCLTPPFFFQILSNPLPCCCLQPLNPTSHSVVLFLWLNVWSHQIWWANLLNDIMNVHMSSLRTFMHVLCNKASNFIVCIGVSIPYPLQKHHLLFFAKLPPLLKSMNCPSPPPSFFNFSFFTLSHLLKVTKILVKSSQFKFLIVTEKHFCL